MSSLPVLKPVDFASDQDVRWCPGCGDYSILAQMKKVLPELGVPREKMHLAVVVHGSALQSMTHDAAYQELNGMDNPTLELVERLGEAGVQLYVCGQSMAFRGWDKGMLASPVKLAPSAMTMMHLLQSQGYTRQ